MTVEKVDARSRFKRSLDNLSGKEKKVQSCALVEKLTQFLKPQAGIWAMYSPLRDEPDLSPLVEVLPNIQWAFPKVISKTEIAFYPLKSIGEMRLSSWGIHEPNDKEQKPLPKEKLSGCIVPGLSFDSYGYRLGRGGGYYDRFLMNYKGLKLGVTFEQSMSEEPLPSEVHDEVMNIVVSPKCWIEINASEVKHGI